MPPEGAACASHLPGKHTHANRFRPCSLPACLLPAQFIAEPDGSLVQLGEGAHGVVYLAKMKDTYVAVKVRPACQACSYMFDSKFRCGRCSLFIPPWCMAFACWPPPALLHQLPHRCLRPSWAWALRSSGTRLACWHGASTHESCPCWAWQCTCVPPALPGHGGCLGPHALPTHNVHPWQLAESLAEFHYLQAELVMVAMELMLGGSLRAALTNPNGQDELRWHNW